jgi:hypothetical protein
VLDKLGRNALYLSAWEEQKTISQIKREIPDASQTDTKMPRLQVNLKQLASIISALLLSV